MKIHTEQNKPHRKRMSVAQVITVSLSLIKYGVTIVYIGRIQMHYGEIQIYQRNITIPN